MLFVAWSYAFEECKIKGSKVVWMQRKGVYYSWLGDIHQDLACSFVLDDFSPLQVMPMKVAPYAIVVNRGVESSLERMYAS
jgi:hypothetical protein